MPENSDGPLCSRDLVIRGTIMALIITVPSLLAFLVSWSLLDDLFEAAIIGGVVHFIAMGFSLKISKRLLIRKTGSDADV